MSDAAKPAGRTVWKFRLLLSAAVFSRICRITMMYPEQVSACSGFLSSFLGFFSVVAAVCLDRRGGIMYNKTNM